MICEIVVGATGTGKSEHALSLIRKKNVVFVYDYQNNKDYIDIPKFTGEYLPKARLMRSEGYTYKDFMDIAKRLYFNKDALIVCDEASNMFETNNKDLKFNDYLLSKRHIKTNFVLLFHNFRQVPPFIVDYTDLITVKRSNGGLDHLKKKGVDERIYHCYLECRKDIRNTYIVGISNMTPNIFIHNYFTEVTEPDKYANNGKNSYNKDEHKTAILKAKKIKNYEF